MANATLGGYGASAPENESGSAAAFANIIGAVISFAILLLLIGWGARTLMRDASGVPVVQALDGPMRVAPAEPGGVPASHQGLSVNQVAANSPAPQSVPNDLRLAPQPVALTADDQPMSQLAAPQSDLQVATAALPVPDAAPVKPTGIEQLAAQIAATAQPLSDLSPAAIQAPAVQTSLSSLPSSGGLSSSLRPVVRPASASAGVAPAQPAAIVSPFDAAVAKGTALAQLGAFDSRSGAETEWKRIQVKYGDFVAGKSPVIQTTVRNGKTFHRLRVQGFATSADSRRFCGAITAKDGACFPVVMK